MNDDLMTMFNKSYLYEEYKSFLDEPLDMDAEAIDDTHFQECHLITNNKIQLLNRRIILKPLIECLYFVYVDYGRIKYDDKYWFFIGKLKNGLYFSYEVGCSGTGFGLGETSKIYFSNTKELLLLYGLTDKQRNIIDNFL